MTIQDSANTQIKNRKESDTICKVSALSRSRYSLVISWPRLVQHNPSVRITYACCLDWAGFKVAGGGGGPYNRSTRIASQAPGQGTAKLAGFFFRFTSKLRAWL